MEEEKKTEKRKFKEQFARFHDKHYKTLILLPLAVLVFSFIFMGVFYSQNHDFINKDVSLTGGTTVTINQPIDVNSLSKGISDKLEGVNIRAVSDLFTNKQIAVIVETILGLCTAANER